MKGVATAAPLPESLPEGFDDQPVSSRNPARPMKGVQCWINPNNGFAVMGVGFEADPDKDTDEFRKMMAGQMGGEDSSDYQRYMMRNWRVRKGDAVFHEFIDKPGDPTASHVIVPKTPVPAFWSRRRALDPGIRNPFAVDWWTKSPEGIHVCYRELYIRNAFDLRQNTPQGWMLGLNVVKYRVYLGSRQHGLTSLEQYDSTVVDPSSVAPRLAAGMGYESARTNVLEDLRNPPYPIDDCVPARRSGAEYLDVERIRAMLFQRKKYKVLGKETLEFLGLEFNPAGYQLFGGYFTVNCKAHIFEFKNLRWSEVVDDAVNKPEKIQDVDNHCWDATKYALFDEWDPRATRPDVQPKPDFRKYRSDKMAKKFRGACRKHAADQKEQREFAFQEG